MPVRIYTSSPASQLLDDRPFGIVAWSDNHAPQTGEAYIVTYPVDGKPVQQGMRFPLVATDFEGGIERHMRLHLAKLWAQAPGAMGAPFEALREEIPVAEFAILRTEKPGIAKLAREIVEGTQCEDLAIALASFRGTEAVSRVMP